MGWFQHPKCSPMTSRTIAIALRVQKELYRFEYQSRYLQQHGWETTRTIDWMCGLRGSCCVADFTKYPMALWHLTSISEHCPMLIQQGGPLLIELPVPTGSGNQGGRGVDLWCARKAASGSGLPYAVTRHAATRNAGNNDFVVISSSLMVCRSSQ